MLSKKTYEKAASIVQTIADDRNEHECNALAAEDAFVRLFRDDNPRFDEARFRAACVPGANVKARKVTA